MTVTAVKDVSLAKVHLDTLSGNADVQGFSCNTAALSFTSRMAKEAFTG